MCMYLLEHKTQLLILNVEASQHINLIATALILRLNSPFQLNIVMSQSTKAITAISKALLTSTTVTTTKLTSV